MPDIFASSVRQPWPGLASAQEHRRPEDLSYLALSRV